MTLAARKAALTADDLKLRLRAYNASLKVSRVEKALELVAGLTSVKALEIAVRLAESAGEQQLAELVAEVLVAARVAASREAEEAAARSAPPAGPVVVHSTTTETSTTAASDEEGEDEEEEDSDELSEAATATAPSSSVRTATSVTPPDHGATKVSQRPSTSKLGLKATKARAAPAQVRNPFAKRRRFAGAAPIATGTSVLASLATHKD